MRTSPTFVLALALLAAPSFSIAADGEDFKDLVKASLLIDAATVAPGSSFTLGVHLKMKPHWHTYWVNPGESGEPTVVKLKGPAGITFGAVQWPVPSKIISFGATTYAYEDDVMLLVPVQVARDAKLEPGAAIEAHVTWLACHETCIEGEAKLTLPLPVSKAAEPHKALFEKWRSRLPLAEGSSESTIDKVVQATGKGTLPKPLLTIDWKEAPAKVDFYPIATRAVAIENVKVTHEGTRSKIEFKPQVFKPEQVPAGKVYGVVVIENEKGERRGIVVPFKVDTTAE